MSEKTLEIIMTALPPTLVALGALVVGVINSIKSDKIHVLVNSNLTAVKADLAIANTQIKDLQTMVALQAQLATDKAKIAKDEG
jgi:hypothetical protein